MKTPEPGKGVLFTSKERRSEKAPDLWGQLVADKDIKTGDVIKISAWTKQTTNGPLISMAIDNWKPGFGTEQKKPFVSKKDVDSDEIPF